MKVCLAASFNKRHLVEKRNVPYMLESFYYVQDWQMPMFKKCDLFLLDSGAFTFMNSLKGFRKDKIDFDKYLDKYIEFINKWDVKYFFELDIDSVVGYEKVKEMRRKLELMTGKKCIPVWHKSRGLDEWKRLCEEYDYVAIGGIVTKEISKKDYKFLLPLLEIARRFGSKVHGLGFTSISELPKYKFYSVDSTSWKSGDRYGQLHLFKNGKITSYKPKNTRAIDPKKIDAHNFEEWLKFQKHAERYL